MSDLQGYEALMARLTALGHTDVEMRTLQLGSIREAKLIVHRRTGHLARSIVPGKVTKDSAVIEARTPYAAAEELGRKAVVIKPKNRRVLAWGGTRRLSGSLASGSKATHFAKEVHQPARKGHPYIVPGAKKAFAEFRDVIVDLWNRAA